VAVEFTLTASSLTSTDVTIGGSSVGASADFRPVPHVMPVFGARIEVTVPANGATLVDTF